MCFTYILRLLRPSVRYTQELKPSRTFRLSEVVAYESALSPSPSLPARTHMRYATVMSFRTSGDEGLGLTRVRLKTAPTHFTHLLSSEIFTFKVRTSQSMRSNISTLLSSSSPFIRISFPSLFFYLVIFLSPLLYCLCRIAAKEFLSSRFSLLMHLPLSL